MPEFDDLVAQVNRLSVRLDKQLAEHERVLPYLDGSSALPELVTQARLTRLYGYLMPTANAPWGSLVVDSKLDRLEIAGLTDTDQDAADTVWSEAWQANGMDSESKLAHGAALLDGRAFATVWPRDGKPEISLDDSTQMVVEFESGSRRRRVAALRRWREGDTTYATLYRRDGLYKFQGPEGSADTRTTEWAKREVSGEDWPLENPFDAVPVVEIGLNRRLVPGPFPFARGEYAHCTGLLDRINLLTFLGLVVAIWMGFPLRGVTGEKIRREILKDDDGAPIVDEATGEPKTRNLPPFEPRPDSVAQFENPEARVFQLAAADRKNLSVFAELDQLAVITKTPRHYFPLEQGMSNLAADAIRASEGGMHAAVTGHKAAAGDSWVDVARLSGQVLGVDLSPQAAVQWLNHESRSLAERADAYVKLAQSLPWTAAAELALNVTQDQIAKWQAQQATGPLLSLLDEARRPTEPNVPDVEEPAAAAASSNGSQAD